MQVKIPVFDDWTSLILIPFVLLVAKSSTDSSDNPFGKILISNSVMEYPVNIGTIKPLSTAVLVSLLTTTIVGGVT